MSIGMTRLAMTRLACIAEAFMVPSSRAAALTLPAVGRAGRRFGFGVGCENLLGCQPRGEERRTLDFAGRRELLEMMRPTCGQAHAGGDADRGKPRVGLRLARVSMKKPTGIRWRPGRQVARRWLAHLSG